MAVLFFRHTYVLKAWLIAAALLAVTGCTTTTPPGDINNACSIVKQRPSWYYDAREAYKKWGVPVNVQLAMIYKESSFRADARPPRTYLLGFIPWGHVTTATGYSQAVDGTWDMYKKNTGNSWASRSDFEDSVDFIGWYSNYISKTAGVNGDNPYMLYLAYYLGPGAIKSGSYKNKPQARKLAKRVQEQASRYRIQLRNCDIPEKSWW